MSNFDGSQNQAGNIFRHRIGQLALVLGLAVILAVLVTACSGPEPTASATSPVESTQALPANSQPPTERDSTNSSMAATTEAANPTEIRVTATAAPTASFSVDVASGSAPLSVSFSNTSRGSISVVEWDFGDGTSSTEASPSHRYTQAGTYTVQLKVNGPGGSDTTELANLISVTPGPVARLEVSPTAASVAVQGSAQFTVTGLDEFENEIAVSVQWSAVSGGGDVDASGRFTAGTVADSFPDTVEASLQTGAGELTAVASVTVEPGDVTRLTIDPTEVTLGIGDPQVFSFVVQDEFGNLISDVLFAWATPTGAGDIDANGVFTSGTKAGAFPAAVQVEVVKDGSRATAAADVSIQAGPLARITLDPEMAVIERGEQQQFVAVAQDQYGNEIPEVAFLWEANGGYIDQEGIYTAGEGSGIYEVSISASVQGRTSTAVAKIPVPPVWIPVGDMNWVRSRHAAIALPGDRVLIVGSAADAEIFDLETRSFRSLGNVPCANSIQQTMTPLQDGNILIAGGSREPRCAQIFDPEAETFHRVGDMNEGHVRHTATLLPDGKVLITGGRRHLEGEGNEETHPVAEIYDPATQTFSLTGNLSVNRQNHRANLLPSGKVLIAIGNEVKWINGEFVLVEGHDTAELYDPATSTFTLIPDAHVSNRSISSLLSNGNVLFTTQRGGLSHIFDPGRDQFRETGGLSFALHGPITSTVLVNGQVLIVGGHDRNIDSLITVAIYDPATETYSIAASLTEPRSAHTATLLSNGWVLVTGGETGEGEIGLRSAELFIPSKLPAANPMGTGY